jgi:uncharacterized protein (TIGR02596 family)
MSEADMIQNPKSPIPLPRAFSLIELLTVIAIIAILAVLVAPGTSSILSGTNLQRAGAQVQQTFGIARQMAASRNRRMEVRFYGSPQGSPVYQSFQTFLIEENGTATPASKVSRLPEAVAINQSATLSPIISSLPVKTWTSNDSQVTVGGMGTDYVAKAVQFRPDGSTSLTPTPANNWFLTLHAARIDQTTADTTKIANFITIQLDPVSGISRLFQP